MKGLFIQIEDDLERRFSDVCRKRGFKKGRLVSRLIREFLEREREEADPIEKAREWGIDTNLLASGLRRTPTERLRRHNDFLSMLERIRGKSRKKKGRSGQKGRQPPQGSGAHHGT